MSGNNAASTPQATSLDKLAVVINPMLEKYFDALKAHITAENQKLQIEIQNLNTKFEIFEKLVSEKKKTPLRNATGKADASATENTNGEVQVAQSTAKSTFPANRMFYFKKEYTNSPGFRERYDVKFVTEDVKGKIAANQTIQSKAKEDLKHAAIAHFIWTYYKDNADFTAFVNVDYEKAKAEHDQPVDKQPAQLTAEAVTPKTQK